MFDSIDIPLEIIQRAAQVKLLLTDCDGVLTDNGVYYSAEGEVMKRFSIRDGMGVERLRNLADVAVGIMTGERSGSLAQRAEKLQIKHVYLGVKDKRRELKRVAEQLAIQPHQIAYIGDDTNDLEIMEDVGLVACPGDAMWMASAKAHYICKEKGGYGAFREFAELIIYCKQKANQ